MQSTRLVALGPHWSKDKPSLIYSSSDCAPSSYWGTTSVIASLPKRGIKKVLAFSDGLPSVAQAMTAMRRASAAFD